MKAIWAIVTPSLSSRRKACAALLAALLGTPLTLAGVALAPAPAGASATETPAWLSMEPVAPVQPIAKKPVPTRAEAKASRPARAATSTTSLPSKGQKKVTTSAKPAAKTAKTAAASVAKPAAASVAKPAAAATAKPAAKAIEQAVAPVRAATKTAATPAAKPSAEATAKPVVKPPSQTAPPVKAVATVPAPAAAPAAKPAAKAIKQAVAAPPQPAVKSAPPAPGPAPETRKACPAGASPAGAGPDAAPLTVGNLVLVPLATDPPLPIAAETPRQTIETLLRRRRFGRLRNREASQDTVPPVTTPTSTTPGAPLDPDVHGPSPSIIQAAPPVPDMPPMPPMPAQDAAVPAGSILSPASQTAGSAQPALVPLTGASGPASLTSTAATETQTPSFDEMLNVDLRETEIKAFIKVLSERTHTNWLFDPNLAGKVTLLGPGQMTLREALALLRSILEFKDLTVETVGSVSRIVPRNQGRFRNTELRLNAYVAPGDSSLEEDKLVTQYVRLKYRNANDIRGILLNFCRDGAAILPYLPTNSLFVTDNGTYIHRLMKIVEELDTPDTSKRVAVIPLRYAFAKTILQPLTEIIKQTRDLAIASGASPSAAAPKPETPVPAPVAAGGAPTAAPTILVDDADNQLLVIALPEELDSIQAAVRLLDKDPGHVPEIRLLPLRHSDPESVARLVTDAFKSDPAIGSSVKAFSVIPDKRTGSLMVTTYSPAMMERVVNLVQKLDIPMITAGAAVRVYKLEYAEAKKVAEVINGLSGAEDEIATSVVGSGSTTGSAKASGSPLDIFGRPAGATNQGQGGTPNAKQTTVIADEATNSLVIVATRQRFDQLTSVIRELDVVRPQVLVEVLIVRIDVDRARHLGLDFNAVDADSKSGRPFAIGSTGQLGSLFSTTGVRAGLNMGLLDSGNFDIAAAARGDLSQLTKIGVLINVLSTDSRANILSAPKLLTGDNQEAKITVGAQVRIPQGSTLNAINTITNFVTEDLGVMMQLTPRITKNDFVAMKIKAQIKNLIPNQAVAGLPVISNSDIETNITVENKATIAMGGLIQEEERETVTKIPILGNLPIVGRLFRDTQKSKNKSNLLVFMTPHIIRTTETAATETQRISPVLRYVEIKETKRTNREDAGNLLKAMNEAR